MFLMHHPPIALINLVKTLYTQPSPLDTMIKAEVVILHMWVLDVG